MGWPPTQVAATGTYQEGLLRTSAGAGGHNMHGTTLSAILQISQVWPCCSRSEHDSSKGKWDSKKTYINHVIHTCFMSLRLQMRIGRDRPHVTDRQTHSKDFCPGAPPTLAAAAGACAVAGRKPWCAAGAASASSLPCFATVPQSRETCATQRLPVQRHQVSRKPEQGQLVHGCTCDSRPRLPKAPAPMDSN